MPTLTVQNAEIKTAAVEVKTLTISGKQVTLAVFRQIKAAPWYVLDAPAGPAWGTVNYHPEAKACDQAPPHLHVVWQLRDELRRARIDRPASPREALGRINLAVEEHDVLRCPQFAAIAYVTDDGQKTAATFLDQAAVFGPRLTGVEMRIDEWSGRFRSKHTCSERCGDRLTRALRSWSRDQLEFLGAWQAWDEANRLPQLFIAV